jgi:protein ImuB
LCERLESHALSALELHLTLHLENKSEHSRRLRQTVTMRNPKTFLKLLQLDLTAHPPSCSVIAIHLRMEPAKPRFAQEGLFAPPEPEPERLELTLARIAALVGEGNVGSVELVDTYRPGAFRMTRALPRNRKPDQSRNRMLAFRVCRPPLPAQVQTIDGQPATVTARGIRGKVVSSAGPWRTSGDWWRDDAWARDDWDIAMNDGVLYRIYSEHSTGRWFVDGRYD